MEVAMYCRECGAEIPQGAKFCTSCGLPVGGRAPRPPQPEEYREGPPAPCDDLLPSRVAPTRNSRTPHASVEPTRRKRRPARVTICLVMLCLGLVFIFEIVGYLVSAIPGMPLGQEVLVTFAGAAGACVSVVILGGRKLLSCRGDTIVLALKKGWWVLATSLGLTVYGVVASVLENETVVEDGWPLRLLEVLVLCIGIGVFEEACFRGLIFGSLLDAGGKSRKGLYIVTIFASLLFGMAHIDWFGMDYADPLSILQAVLKTVQTGLFGFFLCALVMRSKSVWGAALLHALSDFIIMIPGMVLLNGPMDVSYVSKGEEAIAVIVLYIVFIVCYIPLAIIGRSMLSKQPLPDFGPFHKER